MPWDVDNVHGPNKLHSSGSERNDTTCSLTLVTAKTLGQCIAYLVNHAECMCIMLLDVVHCAFSMAFCNDSIHTPRIF